MSLGTQEGREKVSLGKYIVYRSLRALVLYIGVIVLSFFLLIIPLLNVGANIFCLEHDCSIRLGYDYVMVQSDILKWALVPHPDVAEFLNMFLRHVMNCLSGDYGHSFLTQRPIAEELIERTLNSALLIGGSLFASLLIGSGLVAYQEGEKRGKKSVIGRIFTHLNNSTPTFWVGMIALFAGSYALPEIIGIGFPEFGTISNEVWLASVGSGAGVIMVVIDVLFHLCLPMCALTISGSVFIYGTLKSNLTENLTERFLTRECKKGKRSEFIFYSNLKNSLKVIKEWFPAFMSTIILMEVVFTWRGVGRFLFDSILRFDYPAIRGSIITLSLFVILAHLIIDIAFNIMIEYEKDLDRLERFELQSMQTNCYFIDRCM
ncbi:MAG: ABC transporter permease [Candidatus Thorarchaeota archaeon]|nr:MAG: ABC transporter permease [Candidatus Thorarchaeota archaeon]